MALPPSRQPGQVRMYHPTFGETYAPLLAYRDVWYPKGWRSPEDDPGWTGGTEPVSADKVEWYMAAGTPAAVEATGPYFVIDTTDDNAVYFENGTPA